MIKGLLLILTTGLLWAGLAAVVAESSRRHLSINRILPLSALMVLSGTGWICLFQNGLRGSGEQILPQMFLLTAAGIGNYLMLKCVYKAMNMGNGGVIWGITQSSMIIPFMMGLLLFNEQVASLQLTGVGAVLGALFLFSCAKSNKSGKERGWLLPTFAAFVLSSMAQCFASLPSYLQLEGMTSLRRMCLTQVGIILAAAIDMLLRRESISFSRHEYIAAGCFGTFNLAALCCFYYGLNLLADNGYASIGYPVGQGTSIAVFFIFHQIVSRERSSWSNLAALLIMICGILLIAFDLSVTFKQ